MVLSFILIQNRQGKTRLAKWYAPYTDGEKVKLKGEVRQLHPRISRSLTHAGPPAYRPPRPEISIELRRVPIRSFLVAPHLALVLPCPPKPILH